MVLAIGAGALMRVAACFGLLLHLVPDLVGAIDGEGLVEDPNDLRLQGLMMG